MPTTVTDDLLDDLWRQVRALHEALHRARCAEHPQRDGRRRPCRRSGTSRPRRPATNAHRRAVDLAELLTSTAVLVGDDRAVAALSAGFGADALRDVIPMLQAPALTRTTQRMLGKHKEAGKRLDALRSAAAKAAGVDVPQLVELHRVSPTNLMMAIGTLIAAAVLLGQVGSPQEIWDTVKNAEWWLVGLALVLSLATNIPYAIALMGCVPIRLPLWPTTETQLAMSFGNLAIPAIGGIAIQIRFLQKRGLDLASAVAAGGLLSTVANVVCQILLFVIAVVLSPTTVDIGPIDTASAIEVVLIVIVVILVGDRDHLGNPAAAQSDRPARRECREHGVGRGALPATARVCSCSATSVCRSSTASCCSRASRPTAAASTTGRCSRTTSASRRSRRSSRSRAAVPRSPPSGCRERSSRSGVPEAVAVSAILTQQLVVSYIPAVPGWWASNDLLKRGEI